MYIVYKYEGTGRLLPMRSGGGGGGGGGRSWGGDLTFVKNLQANSLPTGKSF